MLRKPLMLVTAAGAFIMVQGPALAQSNCGGGGGGGIWANYCSKKPAAKVKPAVKANPNADAAADAAATASPASPAVSADANGSAAATVAAPAASAAVNAPAAPAANANATAAPAASAAVNAPAAPAADANAAVVAGAGALGASALAGINTGQEVKTSAGAALGKVSKVVKGPDGSVSQVIVTSAAGRSFPVAAGKLSVNGGVLIVSDSSDQ